jgi:hypothetical protein
MEFVPYPKTPRLKRDVVITEKIDGTNAQVVITSYDPSKGGDNVVAVRDDQDGGLWALRVGSRTRWISPGKDTDNFGFAAWCRDNAEELFKLGEGQHFGEWYGQGIQRGYGLDHKRFALFNTARWGAHNPNTPACCHVVPVLSLRQDVSVEDVLEQLRTEGSRAVPGFMSPEGIIVYHSAAKQCFKVLLENDQLPKGLVQA